MRPTYIDQYNMQNCQSLEGFVPDDRTNEALRIIASKQQIGNLLAPLITSAVLINLFSGALVRGSPSFTTFTNAVRITEDVAGSSVTGSAYNISQTDWISWATTLQKLPSITRRAIEKEAELMLLHYELNYDRKHVVFWRNFLEGC